MCTSFYLLIWGQEKKVLSHECLQLPLLSQWLCIFGVLWSQLGASHALEGAEKGRAEWLCVIESLAGKEV